MLYFFFQSSKFYGMEQSLSESLQFLSEIPFKIIYYVTDTSTYFFLTIPTFTYFINSPCLKLFNTIKLAVAVHRFYGYIE